MVVGGSVRWGVDRCVCSGVVSADGITFGINDGYDMYYYNGLFNDLECFHSNHLFYG